MINTGKTYESLEEALKVLNTSYVKKGEYIILQYYIDSSKKGTDILVAVGTKDGIGPGSYSLIATESIQMVKFVSELPDSSSLKNGELYIWTGSEDSIIYKVYLSGTLRVVEEVNSEMFVRDSSSGAKYCVDRVSVKKFSDFITIQDLFETGKTLFLTEAEYDALPTSMKTAPGNIFVIVSEITNQ